VGIQHTWSEIACCSAIIPSSGCDNHILQFWIATCMNISSSLFLWAYFGIPYRPRSSLSLGGQTVESLQLARETTPPSLISFPLPLFPLHSPSTTWTTRRNGVLSNCHTATPPIKSRSHTPSLETYSQAASCLGTSLRVSESTAMKSTTTEGAPVRGLTRGGQRHWRLKENDRDRNTLLTGNSSRVHSQFPANFANQIRAILARTSVYRELRARALQASRGI